MSSRRGRPLPLNTGECFITNAPGSLRLQSLVVMVECSASAPTDRDSFKSYTFLRSLGVLTIPFLERIKSDLGSENNELYVI